MSNFFEYMFSTNRQPMPTNINDKVVEDERDKYHTTRYYLVKCRDGEGSLRKLLNYIAKNGNGGHSFDIVVDAGDKEREKHFFWDGDGCDRIDSIVESKTGEDKDLVGILLAALGRLKSIIYAAEFNDGDERTGTSTAIAKMSEIVTPLLEGVEWEDKKEEALREVRHILLSDDSDEKKLDEIRGILDSAEKL